MLFQSSVTTIKRRNMEGIRMLTSGIKGFILTFQKTDQKINNTFGNWDFKK